MFSNGRRGQNDDVRRQRGGRSRDDVRRQRGRRILKLMLVGFLMLMLPLTPLQRLRY